jgi:Methyltransferase FkbM domain
MDSGVGGWGGIATEYDSSRLGDVKNKATELRVACMSLTDVVDFFGVTHVNYLSVDTEGSELQALRSFPWKRVSVDVVGVEVLTGTPDRKAKEDILVAYMDSQGYQILKHFDFAGDTADIFFTPIGGVKVVTWTHDSNKFEKAKKTCQLLQRCL